jgi:eukaryotic-like serine/threonine-protein kinase
VTTAPQLDLAASLSGRYTIERELGRGGMATVYLARDLKHERQVALKVLHPELAATVGPDRFRREIMTVAQLQHPHILSVFDSGETSDRQLWFTMPFVAGESLRDRLRRERQLGVGDAVRITREVAGALAYAHAHGVLHRDIKPENILLTPQGDALLADFGIARALGAPTDGTGLTERGMAVGTPQYMSPEQAAGERTLDARSDVYALGAVCYEMLAGEPPFVGSSAQAVVAKIMSGDAPSVRVLRPSLTPAFDAALRRALARVPADRWSTADAFVDALATAERTGGRPVVSGRLPTGLSLLGLGFLVGIGALFAWRSRTREAPTAAGPARLAVLPFDNIGDSADAYFADGMTDAVRGKLTAVPGLEVIASVSSERYRHSAESMADIGRELGVRYLVIGKVRWAKRAGGPTEVEVRPALVDVGTAADKWEQSFAAPLTDVFQLQADIAGKVAQQLRVALTPTDRQRLASRPTDSLEAYDSYLRGQAFEHEVFRSATSLRDIDRATDAYGRATRIDPTFALAWAGLGRSLLLRATEVPDDRTAPGRAKSAIDRALVLDSTLAVAHAALASYLTGFAGDTVGGERETRRASELAPNDAERLSALTFVYADRGQVDSAVSVAERVVQLDPRSEYAVETLIFLAVSLRRWDEARRYNDEMLASDSASEGAWQQKMFMSRLRGDTLTLQHDLAQALRHLSAPGNPILGQMAYAGSAFAPRFAALTPADLRLETLFDSVDSYYDSKADLYTYLRQPARVRAYEDSIRLKLEGRTLAGPKESVLRIYLAGAYGALGRMADGRRVLEAADAAERRQGIAPWGLAGSLRYRAGTLARLGEADSAIAALSQVLTLPLGWTARGLAIDPKFYALHGNPRFERLIAQSAKDTSRQR